MTGFKNFFSAVLIIGLVFLSASCGNDDDQDGPPEFTARIDGFDFTTSEGASAELVGGELRITAQTDTRGVVINIPDFDGEGRYDFAAVNAPSDGAALAYTGGPGEVAFTSNTLAVNNSSITISVFDTTGDGRLSGAFATDVRRLFPRDSILPITDGSFRNLPLTTDAVDSNADAMMATIGGQPFTATSVRATAVSVTNQINVTGTGMGDYPAIGINMPNDIDPGTYDITSFGTYNAGLTPDATTMTLVAQAGTLTILEHNRTMKRIKGTFSFNASDSSTGGGTVVPVTGGKFTGNY